MVGLYLDAPDKAMVLAVDEKSQKCRACQMILREAWPDRTGRMCLHGPEGNLT